MSNALLESAKDLQRFAKLFAGVAALAPELERIGSLQQAGDEAKAQLDAIAQKKAAAEADLADVLGKIEGAKADHETVIAAAKAKAAEILDDASKDALKIKADAKELAQADANAIVGQADAEAAELENTTAAGKRALVDLDAQIAAKQGELESAVAAAKAAQAKLDEINAQIKAIHAKLA